MRHTLPLRGERFRCGHERTPANTYYSGPRGTRERCRACRVASQDRARRKAAQRTWAERTASPALVVIPPRRPAKYQPKPVVWINAPRAVIESCRSAFERAIEPKKPTGRPRKNLNIPASEAA